MTVHTTTTTAPGTHAGRAHAARNPRSTRRVARPRAWPRLRDARHASHASTGVAGYPRRVPEPIILGYDPETLRERIDVEAAETRLADVQPFRSLAAMNEQVALLRMLGRLDEAFELAQAAYRQSRFTGAREDALAARIRRAQVQQYQGKLDAALIELSGCVDEAVTHEWHEHAGFALQHRGRVKFDQGDYRGALDDFERALEERGHEGIPPHQVESTTFAIRATRAIIDGSGATAETDAAVRPGIPPLDA